MLQAQESEAEQRGMIIARQFEQIDAQIARLSATPPQDSGETQETRRELLSETKRERLLLKYYSEACAKAISDIHEAHTGISIGNVEFSTGGKALVGRINLDGSGTHTPLKIGNVTASSKGKGIVGEANNIDANNFFAD
jgi:hypothetical protein